MSKIIIAIILSGILLLSMAGCGKQVSSNDTIPTASARTADTVAAIAPVTPATIGDDDMDSSWDEGTATKIALGASISVKGDGASAKDNVVTITAGGTYVVSGTLPDGQIVVDATTEDVVRLVLNGAEITNKSGAAIYAIQCDKLIVTLASGTQNSVTDGGSSFVYSNTEEEEPNAALFSKDDLTINGTGALTVNAGFNNGIGTKDDLIIVSGNFTIKAKNHGMRGNDSVSILDGDFDITSGDDGIQTSNAEESGTIDLRGGLFKIVAAHDGIQSENGLLITGGEFDIRAGGTTTESAGSADTSGSSDTSDSYKGVKAKGDIEISAGEFAIDSADDSLHSNGNISIHDGSFTLASGDDAIHADSTLTVSGGNLKVTESYEGLEGTNVDISAGTIVVHSTDDGINAAGGTNAGVGGGPFGDDQFSGDSSAGVSIRGGDVTLYTTSDGVDANGTLTVTGGTVAVFIGTTRDGDATDVDNGGTIPPALYGTANIGAGTKIAVGDLWSLTAESNVTSYCLIIPGVVNGQSYPITANGTALATVTATTTIQGMMGGGNAGGMGGGGHRGGGRREG